MEFYKIQTKRSEIQHLFVKLEELKGTIQAHYTTLLVQNESNQFFGLDSFRFQVKLMENETRHLKEQMVFIENRLYCDYYKLYVRVLEYLSETFHFEVPKNTYPLYKDLDPFKVYEFEHTSALFHENVAVLKKANNTLEVELKKRTEDERLSRTGIHIGNYVHNRIFKDTIIQTNLGLFEQYLNTYFNYHMTFLTNMSERIVIFLKQFTRSEPVPETEPQAVPENPMVEPEPEKPEPEPEKPEPEPEKVEPASESEKPETEPQAVPENPMVEPEPEKPEPEMVVPEPASESEKPEPEMVEPEPEKPESEMVEPEPEKPESEMVEPEPEKPESEMVEPEPEKPESEMAEPVSQSDVPEPKPIEKSKKKHKKR